MVPHVIKKWHELFETKNVEILDELLADNATMYSPVVYTPQKGKDITKLYLMGASVVLAGINYVREVYDDGFAMLEFEGEIDGKYINGVDMISWNENNQITDFKVMVRPLQGVQALHKHMGEALDKLK